MTRDDAIRLLTNMKGYTHITLYEWLDVEKEALDMAIEALSAVCDDCIWHVCNYNKVDWDTPSAEAVEGWIPCSERLPSDSGNYLITVADLRLGHNGEHTVTMADFYAKAKKWNSVVDVYAWMPLPEPYKGGEEDE